MSDPCPNTDIHGSHYVGSPIPTHQLEDGTVIGYRQAICPGVRERSPEEQARRMRWSLIFCLFFGALLGVSTWGLSSVVPAWVAGAIGVVVAIGTSAALSFFVMGKWKR